MFDVFFALEKDGKRELLYKDCGLFYSSIIGTDTQALCGSIGLFLGQLAKLADKAPSGLESIMIATHQMPSVSAFEGLSQQRANQRGFVARAFYVENK